MHLEGKNLEEKTPTKTEGRRETRANTAIKRNTTGETEVEENEMEPQNMTNCATEKRLIYVDNKGKVDETGNKIVPIHQETQSEELVVRDHDRNPH